MRADFLFKSSYVSDFDSKIRLDIFDIYIILLLEISLTQFVEEKIMGAKPYTNVHTTDERVLENLARFQKDIRKLTITDFFNSDFLSTVCIVASGQLKKSETIIHSVSTDVCGARDKLSTVGVNYVSDILSADGWKLLVDKTNFSYTQQTTTLTILQVFGLKPIEKINSVPAQETPHIPLSDEAKKILSNIDCILAF